MALPIDVFRVGVTPLVFLTDFLSSRIRFELPEDAYVVLKIFNTLGQEIRTLVQVQCEAGFYGVRWDGKNR